MIREQKLVGEFMRKANHPVPPVPKVPKNEVYQLRQQLITEEYNEFLEAHFEKDIIKIIDSLCDMLYVIYGYANSLGIDLEPHFNEVHRSNMEKIQNTGVQYDSTGKVMKPPGWNPPSLQEIYLGQCNDAAKGKRFDRTVTG